MILIGRPNRFKNRTLTAKTKPVDLSRAFQFKRFLNKEMRKEQKFQTIKAIKPTDFRKTLQ